VRENYEKLAPIVIQGSYHLPPLEDAEKLNEIERICQKLLFSEDSVLVVTAFETANENAMKNYILRPHKRLELSKGKVWIIKGGI
jgi:hypothetical protein